MGGGVDRGIELMPKSCPTEPVAGCPRDIAGERGGWETEKDRAWGPGASERGDREGETNKNK